MSGYVAGRRCDDCGSASPCVPVCGVCRANGRVKLWDAVNAVVVASGGSESSTGVARQRAVVLVESEVDALVDAARDTAHAAGYAEAVADVVAWLRGQVSTAHGAGVLTHDVLVMVADPIRHGCHVGAAKKGGG